MKTKSFRTSPAIVLLHVFLFTLATGAFNSKACQLTVEKSAAKCKQQVEAPAVKEVNLPAVNPLRALSARFI